MVDDFVFISKNYKQEAWMLPYLCHIRVALVAYAGRCGVFSIKKNSELPSPLNLVLLLNDSMKTLLVL